MNTFFLINCKLGCKASRALIALKPHTTHTPQAAVAIALRTLKLGAYCAIFTLIVGCASANKSAQNLQNQDPLAHAQIQSQASKITSLAAAEQQLSAAQARQIAADKAFESAQNQCYQRFFVNDCLLSARAVRNQIWDAAQSDAAAARLYIRQQQAEAQRVALTEKLAAYQAQEKALAPIRAQNAAAYQARQKAYRDKLAQYNQQQAQNAEQRAANVERFEDKLKRIEAIKAKRAAQITTAK